jgi:uncharacterized protein (TIGR02246 family)
MVWRRKLSVVAGVLLMLLAEGCSKPAAPPGAQDNISTPSAADVKSQIRKLNAAWVAAVAARNVEKVAEFYADDGQFLEPGAPVASGRDAITKAWNGLLTSPGFVSLTFSPTSINVAEAGDIAYEVGTYEISMKDAKGKPTAEKGKYVVIWKKQADGSWKVEVDIDNQGI